METIRKQLASLHRSLLTSYSWGQPVSQLAGQLVDRQSVFHQASSQPWRRASHRDHARAWPPSGCCRPGCRPCSGNPQIGHAATRSAVSWSSRPFMRSRSCTTLLASEVRRGAATIEVVQDVNRKLVELLDELAGTMEATLGGGQAEVNSRQAGIHAVVRLVAALERAAGPRGHRHRHVHASAFVKRLGSRRAAPRALALETFLLFLLLSHANVRLGNPSGRDCCATMNNPIGFCIGRLC